MSVKKTPRKRTPRKKNTEKKEVNLSIEKDKATQNKATAPEPPEPAPEPEPEPEPRSRGKPAHVKTQQTINNVKLLAQYGVQGKLIASSIGISEPTLIKHYKADMQESRAIAHREVGRALYLAAVGGNVPAMIWYSKSQMGWRELRPEDSIDQDEDFAAAIDEGIQELRPEDSIDHDEDFAEAIDKETQGDDIDEVVLDDE